MSGSSLRRSAIALAVVALLGACSAAPVPQATHSSTLTPAETATGPTETATAPATSSRAPSTSTPAPSPSSAPSSSPALATTSPAPSTTPPRATTTPATAACPLPSTHLDCNLQLRIRKVQAYVATRPGTVGIVLRDRATGGEWLNQYNDTEVWTASTIKLAMVMDLFIRDREGTITLTSTDRTEIQEMLNSSDDDAADALWFKYSGSDHMTFNRDFASRFGMTGLEPQAGFTQFFPYWGFQKCTPDDLDRLDQYLLTTLDATDRDYIVDQLQHVASDQQWGVWNSGADADPGNKDGWSLEQSGYIANTVGFVGPDQQYTLVVMNSLNGHGDEAQGETTVGTVAKLLFAGRY